MKKLLDRYRKTAQWMDSRGAVPFALARAGIGLLMAFNHGLGKLTGGHDQFAGWLGSMGLPAPDLMAYLAGLAEFGGGLFLAMGLFTRGAALAIIFDLAVALLMVHKAAIFGGPGVNGGELAWIYLLSAVLIAAKGPGKYSLDRKYRLDNK